MWERKAGQGGEVHTLYRKLAIGPMLMGTHPHMHQHDIYVLPALKAPMKHLQIVVFLCDCRVICDVFSPSPWLLVPGSCAATNGERRAYLCAWALLLAHLQAMPSDSPATRVLGQVRGLRVKVWGLVRTRCGSVKCGCPCVSLGGLGWRLDNCKV